VKTLLQIVKIENPFDRASRKIEQCIFAPGKPLTFYIQDEGVSFVVNGNIVDEPESYYPADKMQIIVIPKVEGGFGKIFAMVATMALMYYGGGIMGASHGVFGAMNTFWRVMAAGAVMFIGGKIINAIVPTENNTSSNSSDETYGWTTPSMVTGEGGVIGMTFGEVIPTIQILEQHIETVDDKQYLNLLMTGGIGPVDEITDIKIEGTDIGLFDDVEIELKLGTNDQEPISFFTDTPLDQSIQLTLTTAGLIRTSESTTAVSLEVTLEWGSGLYHVNDSGNYENASVVIQCYYRLTGETEWTAFFSSNQTVKAAQSTALRRAFRVKDLPAGEYEVKAIVISEPTGNRYQKTCTWSILTSYDEGLYSRPNKVLVGMRILATDQLSSSVPTVTWRQTRSIIYAYNPYTDSYVEKPASNPIWAAYDIYHQCRRLKNINTGLYEYTVFGVEHSRLDAYWDEWLSAAAYSDEQVLGSDGVTYENRFTFDYFYGTEMKRYEAAQRAATVGHAVIMPHGNNIGVITDKPGTMVQIFGEGRTTTSSIQGSFSAIDDRALAIEVVYADTDNDFEKTQFLVRSPRWNTSTKEDNTATLTLYGVKRRSQAYREGVYSLANNELITQYIELQTNIDAMVCEYGDIVGYAHSVSQIGTASGRIVSATANTVVLDKEVGLYSDKTYQIIFQLSDDSIVTKNLVQVETDTVTDTVTISEAFSVIPSEYDNYIFGETDNVLKKFRLTGITRNSDLTCKLSLTEYNEDVYDGDLNYPLFTLPAKTTLQNVIALSLAEESHISNSQESITLNLSWSMERGAKYDSFSVFYTANQGTWTYLGTTYDLTAKIPNAIAGVTYYVKVVTKLSGLTSSGTTGEITIVGTTIEPPDALEAFSVTYLSGKHIFSWNKPTGGTEITGYEIRKGAWESGQLVKRVVGADTSTTDSLAIVGTVTFTAKPYNSGGYSANALSDIITIDTLPAVKTLYKTTAFEQLCTSTGEGAIIKQAVYQNTDLTYGDLAALTYEDFLVAQFLGTPLGDLVLLGPIITLDTLTQAYISITETWLWQPNTANKYEISISLDGEHFSDFKLLSSGNMPMKAFQLRITLTGTTSPAIMNSIGVEVIASQTMLSYPGLVIPAGGLTLTFGQDFTESPSVIVSPNTNGTKYEKANVSQESCILYLYDSTSGEDIGGIADVFIVGK